MSHSPAPRNSLRIPVISVTFALLVGAAAGYFWILPAIDQARTPWIAPSEGQARIEGRRLYQQFCAGCHGVNLEGQPNWRDRMSNGRLPAPPHDVSGHTWHHPDDELRSLIRDGLVPGLTAPQDYVSDMPAYAEVLTSEQIDLIIAYIKSHWPDDALEAQRDITIGTFRRLHGSHR